MANKGKPIYSISIGEKKADKIIGMIAEKKTQNGIITGLVNKTDCIWTVSYPGGATTEIKPGEGGPLTRGAIINAGTSKDYTFYYITIPNLDDNLDIAIDLHSDMMLNACFPDEEIGPSFDFSKEVPSEKRERYVVLEEIKMCEDRPWSRTYEQR